MRSLFFGLKSSLSKTLFFSVFSLSVLFSQIPDYYDDINLQLTGEALKNQLSQLIINTHTTNLPYTSNSQIDVWDALRLCDLLEGDNDNVFLVYGWDNNDNVFSSDRTRPKTSTCHTSSCTGLWVREHVYPRSLGTPNLTNTDANSDAHNLRPIDSHRNNVRGNNKFTQGSGQASYIPFSGAWYPGDEWKGDVARMMMYMYLRYPTQCVANNVAIGSSNLSPLGDMPDIFLIWNAEDPVEFHELVRNDVLENLQGNRNPFIDNPYLATLIWNGPNATDTWDLSNLDIEDFIATPTIQIFPNMTADYVYVQSNDQQQTYQYTIVNQVGQEVSSGFTSHKIDLSNYCNGMYFIIFATDSQQTTHKVIKL